MTLIYLPMDCPVCGRHRVEWDGKVLRCEKCTTSSEWDGFTSERYAARSTPAEALQHDTPNDQREHVLDESCWCDPYPDQLEPRVIIHRKEGEA